MSDVYYDLYLDTNDGDGSSNRSKSSQIISFFFKSVFAILAIGIIGILLYRIITIQEPRMADDFLVNQKTAEEVSSHASDRTDKKYDEYYVDYRTFGSVTLIRHEDSDVVGLTPEEYGYNGFEVFTQHLSGYYVKNEETGEYDLIERSEFYTGKDDEGNFKISSQYFMPQSNQLEVTIRFNDNALKNLLAAYPDSMNEEHPFVFVISDNLGNEYGSYSFITKDRANYHYARLLFDGVEYSAGVNTIYLDIYYKGDVSSTPYRSMVIYDANISLRPADIKTSSAVTKNMMKYSVNLSEKKPSATENSSPIPSTAQ